MKEKKRRESEKVLFRRFSNQSYSIFKSIGKEINIGVLLVGMLTYATPQEVKAQANSKTDNNEKEYELEEVEVTASRAPLTISQGARMVTLIDRKSIAQAPAQSVNDLLKWAVGVDVRQRGGQGMQTDISLRGSNHDQITILLNGVNICDPQTGHNAVDLPVDINDIERIEILEGPASRVYGTSSLLGAINIVTKKEINRFIDVSASLGSYGSVNGGAKLNLSTEKISNMISANYNRSDGHLRNSQGKLNANFNAARLYYQGLLSNSVADVQWSAGFSDKNLGSNTFYSAKFDNQFEHTRKIFTSIQAMSKGKVQFKPVLYWTRGEDRFELIKGSEEIVPFNFHSTDIWGVNLNAYFTSVLGKTVVGAEMRDENIKSTILGEPLQNPQDIAGYDRKYTKGLDRTNLSFHIEHNILLNRFTLSAGVMATRNSMYESGFKLYPGVDVSYRFNQQFKIFTSWNSSLRLPTFTELYYTTNETHIGNKQLKPEEMSAYELGVKYTNQSINATVALFHHRGKNLIDWVKRVDEEVWHSINHTKINSTGVEVGATVDFEDIIKMNSLLKSIYLGYSFINQDKKEKPNEVSQYSLEYLKHKFVVRIDSKIWNKLEANCSFRWQDREGNFIVYENKNPVGKADYKPYSLFDAKVVWNDENYKLWVQANNIFNKEYFDYGNVPQPGLWVMVGVNYRFNI